MNGIENDQLYKNNASNSLNSITFIYNSNLEHYQLAKIEYFNINRTILKTPNTILDIFNINFNKLNDGEKCRFITLLSNEYITVLRMLEIEDVSKVINIVGKDSSKITVSDYINKLLDIIKNLFQNSEFLHNDRLLLFKTNNKKEKLSNIIADMKNLIVSTFDNESLAYFIILHCFLCNLYNVNTDYSLDNFLNFKIDKTLIVNEFIKQNEHSKENLIYIFDKYIKSEYKILYIEKEPRSWLNFIALYGFGLMQLSSGAIGFKQELDLRSQWPLYKPYTPLEKARKVFGLKSDGSQDKDYVEKGNALWQEATSEAQKIEVGAAIQEISAHLTGLKQMEEDFIIKFGQPKYTPLGKARILLGFPVDGVGVDASLVKQKYREVQLANHPDKDTGDQQRFIAATDAKNLILADLKAKEVATNPKPV